MPAWRVIARRRIKTSFAQYHKPTKTRAVRSMPKPSLAPRWRARSIVANLWPVVRDGHWVFMILADITITDE
jgi:hypothetical protein